MQITQSLRTLVAGVVIISACGGAGDPTAEEPPLFTLPSTAPPPDLVTCRTDADAGIEATRLAMELAENFEPSSLVAGRWTTTLTEQDPDLADLLDRLETTERQCETAEILSIVVIDRSDEVSPTSFEQSIVWLDSFGPLVGVAQIVDPADAGAYVDAFPGQRVEYPTTLDLETIRTCEGLNTDLATQISGFQAVWDGLTPLDLAASPPPLDPGAAIQAARLRAAELGCSVFELAEAALLELTTTPSTSFVGRSQRLTYGSWILDTMMAPFIINEDDLIAEPIAGSAGLAGFSIANRSDVAQTGIALIVEGDTIIEGERLDPGQSVWVLFAGDRSLPAYTLTWSE